jgi:hypothetical protein
MRILRFFKNKISSSLDFLFTGLLMAFIVCLLSIRRITQIANANLKYNLQIFVHLKFVIGTPALVYISGSSSSCHSVFLLGLADLQWTSVLCRQAKLVGHARGSGPAPGDPFLAHGTVFPAKKSNSWSMVAPSSAALVALVLLKE